MEIIIVGATPFQREIWETLNKDRVIEVEFIDSIVKIESSKFTLINTPTGLMPDFMICGDVIGDHKLNKDLVDFNQGKRLSSLDNLNRSVANKSKPKLITYGPKQSCGKGKIKRWKK